MRKFIMLCAALAAALAARHVSADDVGDANVDPMADPKVIYGSDDRIDLYQIKGLSSPILRSLAGSTVALMRASDVSVSGETASFKTVSYASSYNLCRDEPFYEQETAAFCSGSLVAPDMIMTAGHCVRTEAACKATKFVFGFGIAVKGQLPRSVPAKEVYGCAQLIGREEVGKGADWALIRLDRRVDNHAPLSISRTGDAKNGTKIFVIGHPAGLPTKIAGGASVRDASPKGYFVANLDTYGGNSGSAVFNAASGNVEGILVRGEVDYETRPGQQCNQSKRCPDDGCRGEDVTKISVLAGLIPMRGIERHPLARLGDAVSAAPQASASFRGIKELGSEVFRDQAGARD